MSYVMGVRTRGSGGSGQTLSFQRETFNIDPIDPGTELVLSPPAGYTIDFNTIVVNYNEKLLIEGTDYTSNGTDTIFISFSDSDSGPVIFQVQYTATQ